MLVFLLKKILQCAVVNLKRQQAGSHLDLGRGVQEVRRGKAVCFPDVADDRRGREAPRVFPAKEQGDEPATTPHEIQLGDFIAQITSLYARTNSLDPDRDVLSEDRAIRAKQERLRAVARRMNHIIRNADRETSWHDPGGDESKLTQALLRSGGWWHPPTPEFAAMNGIHNHIFSNTCSVQYIPSG